MKLGLLLDPNEALVLSLYCIRGSCQALKGLSCHLPSLSSAEHWLGGQCHKISTNPE